MSLQPRHLASCHKVSTIQYYKQLVGFTGQSSAYYIPYFSRKKRMKMLGSIMKVVSQISAMSYPEITLLYFLNSKKSFRPFFLIFGEINRSSSSLFSEIINREHIRSQHKKDPFAKLSNPVQYKIARKELLIQAMKSRRHRQIDRILKQKPTCYYIRDCFINRFMAKPSRVSCEKYHGLNQTI